MSIECQEGASKGSENISSKQGRGCSKRMFVIYSDLSSWGVWQCCAVSGNPEGWDVDEGRVVSEGSIKVGVMAVLEAIAV